MKWTSARAHPLALYISQKEKRKQINESDLLSLKIIKKKIIKKGEEKMVIRIFKDGKCIPMQKYPVFEMVQHHLLETCNQQKFCWILTFQYSP